MENNIDSDKLKSIIEDVMFNNKVEPERKLVLYCIDEYDGVLKNFEETLQFRKLMKEEINKL